MIATKTITIRNKKYQINLVSIRQSNYTQTNKHWLCWAKDDSEKNYFITMMLNDRNDISDFDLENDFDWENADVLMV